jgi:TolB-like protein
MSFVSELRRRQVFQTAAWYGGLAWLAVEVADTVFPRFGLPDWSVRAVIVGAALGFPVALALAWSFDLSALGIRRETGAVPAPAARAPPARLRLWRIPSLWIAAAAGIGLTISAQQAWQRLVRPALGERPGLAVLPFANLSPDPANAYVADGLHEEILATLARAGGLRVISRTSVQEYRDPKRNLREIAEALDVSLILEGSVRRDGDDLRLSLQLIDGRTDEHLWAETYDRRFHEALKLQTTVALQVVSELGAKLLPSELGSVRRSAPSVPQAYDSYLRALALRDADEARSDIERLLSEAIESEPGFALAYALRSKVRTEMYLGLDIEAEAAEVARLAEGARADFERALALQPDLPAALVARGLYELHVVPDPDSNLMAGLADLTRALEIAPNDAETHMTAGYTLRRLGNFDAALAHFDQASALTGHYGIEVHWTLLNIGRLAEADRALGQFLARHPTDTDFVKQVRYFIRFLESGDTSGWREAYDDFAPQLDDEDRAHFLDRILVCTGDLAGRVELYERPDAAGGMWSADYVLSITYTALGDRARARPHLMAMVEAGRESTSSFSKADSAVALTLLGEHAAAQRAADEAVQLLPVSRDMVNGPRVAIARAWVLIKTHDRAEEGYAELKRLLGAWGLWPRYVALLPEWRMLTDDPRVQQIFREAISKSGKQGP